MTQDKVVYVHYGSDTFHRPNPIANRDYYFTKPIGGLWASRKNGKFTWKDWCESEEFRLHTFDSSFEFTLKDHSRILELSSIDQLDNLPKLKEFEKGSWASDCCLDFEKLSTQYDAIEVTDIHELYFALYGWDCNSILIMNPDIVEIL